MRNTLGVFPKSSLILLRWRNTSSLKQASLISEDKPCEDCCHLSFEDNIFDAITVAFGVRNFADLDQGLREMHRVLRPSGRLVILELTAPDHFPMKQLFTIYSSVIIPTLGKLLSKDNQAYHYLPQTIQAFPQGEVMKGILQKAGFNDVNFKRLTFGICTLYTANK